MAGDILVKPQLIKDWINAAIAANSANAAVTAADGGRWYNAEVAADIALLVATSASAAAALTTACSAKTGYISLT